MPIFRKNQAGKFVPFEESRPELERELEDWIETSPELLLEGRPLALIGRQVSTSFGKTLDLLAVDETGATVVIELKKGATPREVIAQVIEYTAWVDSLSLDDLDGHAHGYAEQVQVEAAGVADLYDLVFDTGSEHEGDGEEDGDGLSSHVTFNARQRMVIVAEEFPGEMEQTLRYLRGRLGVDISAVQVGVHKLGNETLLETSIVVGREDVGATKVAGIGKPTTSHDAIREKVRTPFLRSQVDELEQWIVDAAPNAVVRHNRGTNHSVYVDGQHLGGFYFAIDWIRFQLNGRQPNDEEVLQGVSDPRSILLNEKRIAANISNEQDLEIYRDRLAARLGRSN